MTATLMIQGTGSNIGKSLLVAGLCRVFARQGLIVRPFKPQTLSNNAAVTADGGEIGRAQALQAQACGIAPSIHMNPVLLKPEPGRPAQIVVQGQRLTGGPARDDPAFRAMLLARVLDSFERVKQGADLVLVEGAGAASETNLRDGDIANMGFARAARVPVVLAGDIETGGVIAQIVGTQAVLDPGDAAIIRGFVINRFHGDPTLFADGHDTIAQRTGWPGLGVVPWFADAHRLPAEDAADLRPSSGDGPFRVVVPRLPHIANFDDLDPLRAEPGLRIEMIAPGRPLPVEADLIVIPGSKATIADLAAFRAQGWDIDLAAALRRGARVLGLCGGYQMLGRMITDPGGIEGPAQTVPGLGLLQVDTVMTGAKRLTRVHARHPASGTVAQGYEIHIGRSDGLDCARALFTVEGQPEGAISTDGQVMGSYLHGLFAADAFRRAFLAALGGEVGRSSYAQGVEDTLSALADHLEAHLDCAALLRIATA